MFISSTDFETRSACDLIHEGAYRYATDPTTQAICNSYMVPDGSIRTWVPMWVAEILQTDKYSQPPPAPTDDYKYQAWNSQFDRLIWQYVCTNDYNWPDTEIEDWICTASLARSNGLPGALEDAARALGIRQQKDTRGKELIQLLSIPCGGTKEAPEFNEDPALLQEMIDYCEQDVRAEHGMAQVMRPFLEHELIEFWASERINDRGALVDLSFARKAVTFSETEMHVLEGRLQEATSGEVERPTQYQRVKKWMLSGRVATPDPDGKGDRYPVDMQQWKAGNKPRVSDEAVKQMTVYKGGERKISLDKAVRHNLLELDDEEPGTLTELAREVVELTDLAGRSSTAKYRKMIDRELDGRLCGMYMFSGAKSTGRFSSTGVQLHNMVRESVDDFDATLAKLETYDDAHAIHTLAKMMRQTFIASPGKRLYWSDWSNVEGRGLPYLANDPRAEKKLELFKHQDEHPDEPDMYEVMAERMRLDDRQTGKVAELSMGFGGGVGAFQAMARNYQVRVADSTAKDIQQLWRRANPWAEPFWYALKDAAWNALTYPNKIFKAGRVQYFYTPKTHNGLGTLWCKLPSGRLLSYVYPKFERVPTPWDPDDTMVELTAIKANWKPKAGDKEWPRYKLWYGVLAENVTQAFCADLMRDVLPRLHTKGIDVVLHTHDDVCAEDERDISLILKTEMQRVPSWAKGLPLTADINSGTRLRKT